MARQSERRNPDVDDDAIPLAASIRSIERAAGSLATASVARMDETLPWFRALPADQRVLGHARRPGRGALAGRVAAPRRRGRRRGPQESPTRSSTPRPRALARSINLQQTVQLIKVTIEVAEEQVPHLAAPGEEQALQEAMLRFSREIAFAAARVYARAAETRGAWDARLQALLVDALLRGDSSDVLASRAAALGWADAPPVAVVVGRSPGGEAAAVLHAVYRAARRIGVEILGGVHGDRLVVVTRRGRRPAGRRGAAARSASATGRSSSGPRTVAGRGHRVGPGGAGRLPGRAGLAGGAPPGGGRRSAARARAGR